MGDYASSAGDDAASHYSVVSSIISELVIGKEPAFTESIYSRLTSAYSVGASSAASLAHAATETVVSAASDVTDAAESVINAAGDKIKEGAQRARDEL